MDHLKQISGALDPHGLDAMLIVSAPGEFYAVGMRAEGITLVSGQHAQLSTDSRYIEAARGQVTGAELALTGEGKTHLTLARDFLQAHGLKRVGFESGCLSVDGLEKWRKALPDCQLIPAQALLDGLRAGKDAGEQDRMRKAQTIADAAFQEVLNSIRPGVTEQAVAARLVYEMMCRGAQKPSFDPIVAAGPNGSRPHAVPGERTIQLGQFVTMDFGCVYQGYCSDTTRTVAVGQPDEEMERVYQTVLSAQKAGIAAARSGITGKTMDTAARQVIQDAGYGDYFSHGFGHSLGLEIHEGPNATPTEERILPVGAVISAEPGIYLPGRFGVRIEDVLILRADGCENITHAPKDLIVL